jgi:predicted ATP-dependent endonuclease of OLD family
MYIREVHIENIRSISKFDMKFREGEEAGWHVLIGDNGSGKTTILRSIALGLVGMNQSSGLVEDWKSWFPSSSQYQKSRINLDIKLNETNRLVFPNNNKFYSSKIHIYKTQQQNYLLEENFNGSDYSNDSPFLPEELRSGQFSAGFGPFRRFTGGNAEKEKIFKNERFKNLSAHLSLFGEDVGLTEITNWLQKLQFQKLENKSEGEIIEYIKMLLNSNDFLPYGTQLKSISSEGVFFIDGNGETIGINQLSDGYRSILSLTLELIRQMISFLDADAVFENIRTGDPEKMNIPLPGVVLIDEIDAHLHPTWQTRIGQWFTKYFPNLQFIVTTHSPLVCRACEKGTIWRLAAPGSNQESGEITGTDRDRLIYGNVLDAYSTEVFGEDISQSENAEDMLKELAELNLKSFKGIITAPQKERLAELKQILPTE